MYKAVVKGPVCPTQAKSKQNSSKRPSKIQAKLKQTAKQNPSRDLESA
jgi:hypothetical protein